VRAAVVFVPASVLLTATVFAAAAVIDLLPPPSHGVLLAMRELHVLARTRTSAAAVTLDGATYRTACHTRGQTTVVTLGAGSELVIRGVNARSDAVGRSLLGALADLAGSHKLLIRELSDRIRRSSRVLAGTVAFDGRKAYLLRVSNLGPRVYLVVAAHGFQPLGIRYSAAGLRGSSLLATGLSHSASNHGGC
jgi:hypothetical protein